MKRIFLVIVLCAASFAASAQNSGDVKMLEFEVGLGGNIGTSKIWNHTPMPGFTLFYLEPRLNIPQSPLDVALQVSMGVSVKGYGTAEYPGGRYRDEWKANYKPTLVAFADYNWRLWDRTSLFAGLGLGMAMVDVDYPDSGGGGGFSDRSMILNPRVGAEFWNHLRVTFEYKLMKKDYSYFGLSIGCAFGGGWK